MEMERYIDCKEAANILGVSIRRISGLCNEGKLEGAYRQGKSWKIPELSVLHMVKDGQKKTEKTDVLPCAVGNTSYKEITQHCYYVDKTLLIRDLIDDHSTVTLFTRPRRFGKTLAMDMLKTFFEKSDEDTSVYFRDKKIWRCGEKYRFMQGRYPVVTITFKDVKFTNWEIRWKPFRLCCVTNICGIRN